MFLDLDLGGANVHVIHGDARALPLEDSLVDLIVTSPPYFGLRTYTDGGEQYEAQIGAERTADEYVESLVLCTKEMVRVLKPSGSLWINLGDKYRNKTLLGLPWRYALRCLDELGLTLRAEVVWSKPNGIPESVTDRVRRSHETWFHFTISPKYFAAIDEIREPHSPASLARYATSTDPIGSRKRYSDACPVSGGNAPLGGRRHGGAAFGAIRNGGGDGSRHTDIHPLGKLPDSVWSIATQPLKVPVELGVDHYAAFPMEWPRRIILAWSPPGGVVLDPFGGTGTTALVADVHGREGITVDASSDYCRVAEWRINDPKQRARAVQDGRGAQEQQP